MIELEWGNVALAFAALTGLLGVVAYFGMSMSMSGLKPPTFEPEMDEPELKVFWPGRARY